MNNSSISFSIDDLTSLNDELVALSRSGVPLDQGLRHISRDLSGKQSKLSQKIAELLEQGHSIDQAIAQLDGNLPPFYQAVIQAGMKSGNLSVALEGLSMVAKRIRNLRTAYWLALPYPLIVLCLTGFFVTFMGLKIQPTLRQAIEKLRMPESHWIHYLLDFLGSVMPYGILVVPLAFALIFIWSISFRNPKNLLRPQSIIGRVCSGTSRVAALSRHAIFFDCLSLMIRNQVPLHEAIPLAAAATGNAKFAEQGKQWGLALERGEEIEFPLELSPLSKWFMQGQSRADQFATWLEVSATRYHREATRLAQWLSSAVPLLLTFFIGGSAVLFYALSLFLPWIAILDQLTIPGN